MSGFVLFFDIFFFLKKKVFILKSRKPKIYLKTTKHSTLDILDEFD